IKRSPTLQAVIPRNSNTSSCRVPAKVIEAQGFSSWLSTCACASASAISAWRTRSPVVRRERNRRVLRSILSVRMVCVRFCRGISVHEMFRPFLCCGTRDAAHPEIEHEARIVRGKTSEFGCGHIVLAEEFLDCADQHSAPLLNWL